VIRKQKGKFVLYSADGSKRLGVHESNVKAEAQETAIKLSKARAAGKQVPPPPK